MWEKDCAMRKKLHLTNLFIISLLLLGGNNRLAAQFRLFDVSIFDDRVLEIGYREDSLLLTDEISFMRQEAAMRRGALEQQSSEATEDLGKKLEAPAEEMPEGLREKRLAEFPPYLVRTVPQDAIFMEVENGEGINVQGLDNNNALILIEDKYQQNISLRFEKLRISTLVIRIYGHDGRLVYNNRILQKPQGYELKLSTRAWPKGIYRFQFKIDDGRWKEKVLVKNSPAR